MAYIVRTGVLTYCRIGFPGTGVVCTLYWYGWIRVFALLALAYWLFLKFAIAPGLSGGRGEMAMTAPPRWFSSCSVQQTLSLLVPVQRQSIELPATTDGEWRRRHSLQSHKGGLWTVRLTSFHRLLLQGGFLLCVAGTLWLNEGA